MAQIQNPDATIAIRLGAGLSQAEDFPQSLSNNCVPVMDMTPDFHKTSDVRTAASGTIFTTPLDEDVLVTGVQLAGTKAAADTGTGLVIGASVNGVNRNLIQLLNQTLTAESTSLNREFVVPVKIDRNANITMTLTGTWTSTVGIVNFIRKKGI